ncbi:MAG: helix-turn-helix domain-containing protein [Planktothrix sp.]
MLPCLKSGNYAYKSYDGTNRKFRRQVMDDRVTTKEAAQNLGISEQRVRTICREELLSSNKVGTSWLIDKQSLARTKLERQC